MQGRVEGIEQGRVESIEQRQMNERKCLARLMLSDGVDVATMMKYTGLTAEQIAESGKEA